jgi:predicted nucleic acid-binding protein
MIVDASVWVAIFRENDVHHGASIAFLESAVANQQDLNMPNLALAEIVGVLARQTGKAGACDPDRTGRTRVAACAALR